MQLELLNFPVDRFQAARQHAAAVQRELDVLRVEGAREGHVPRRADDIVADLDQRFTGYRSTMDVLDALVEEGTDHADVVIPILGEPEERAVAVEALADLLDEIDAYCESGEQLLTLSTPPDLREFRVWLFAQVVGQLRGAAPSPWDAAPRLADAEAHADAPPVGSAVVMRESGSLDLGDAARVREELQRAFTEGDGDVTLDLRDVDFVDSVILSVFVTAHKRFAADGRRLTFLAPPILLRLFELTGLVGVLDVRAT